MEKQNKIAKVITKSFYKENYVKINDTIYTTTLAKTTYPHLAKKIDQVSSNLTPSKSDVVVAYKAFPSNKQMLENLRKERQAIYDKLNLSGITGEGADIVKAGVVYCYLIKNTYYNDLATEEAYSGADNPFLESLIRKNIKEYYELKQQKTKELFSNEIKTIEARLKQLAKENLQLQLKQKQKEVYKETRVFLKSVYNALINQKGVCADFSYAYQFLLEGLHIESLVISTSTKDEYFTHALNVNAYMEEGVKKYYLVDVTQGNSYYHKMQEGFLLNGFAQPVFLKEENVEITYIEKLSGFSEDGKEIKIEKKEFKREIFEVQNSIMKDFELEYYVDKVIEFLQNDCKNMNIQKEEYTK
jgi:hypothetical protein